MGMTKRSSLSSSFAPEIVPCSHLVMPGKRANRRSGIQRESGPEDLKTRSNGLFDVEPSVGPTKSLFKYDGSDYKLIQRNTERR